MSSHSSFRITRFPVPESVFKKLDVSLAALSQTQRDFVLHVLASNVINLNKIHRRGLAGWIDLAVELPSAWVVAHFGGKFRPAKVDPRLLSFTKHSKELHKCRTFTAGNELLDSLFGWKPPDPQGVGNEAVVNVFDGAPYAVQVPSSWTNGIFSSKLIRDAVQAFAPCPFNYERVLQHLQRLGAKLSGVFGEQRDRLLGAFRNDNTCAARLCAGCSVDRRGVVTYVPEFRTIYTGRIMEVGGGSQSCSRAMKSAMFEGVPDVRNYDLKRAQAFILLQELEDAGLGHFWLKEYLRRVDANESYAAELGISKDAFKSCLYATIMGAKHSKFWQKQRNEIYRLLVDDCGSEEQARHLAVGVFELLAALKGEVDSWHQHLLGDPTCPRVDPSYKKVRTLRNACAQRFKLEGYHQDKLARKAAAFILQGQEAAFIHRLTLLGKDHGFTPISNQHDGLVVVGEISQAAVDAAAEAAGLRYATMEIKSFE